MPLGDFGFTCNCIICALLFKEVPFVFMPLPRIACTVPVCHFYQAACVPEQSHSLRLRKGWCALRTFFTINKPMLATDPSDVCMATMIYCLDQIGRYFVFYATFFDCYNVIIDWISKIKVYSKDGPVNSRDFLCCHCFSVRFFYPCTQYFKYYYSPLILPNPSSTAFSHVCLSVIWGEFLGFTCNFFPNAF